MWRIEQSDCRATRLELSGRIREGDIAGIQAELARCPNLKALNVRGVTLVDVTVVRFFSVIEGQGIQLIDCPPYVREWIVRERAEGIMLR